MEKKYQCECCKNMLEEKMFYQDERRRFALKLDACKKCKHEKYLKQREKKITYQLKWMQENKEKAKEYVKKYQNKNHNILTA
ncbi:hypothetical protein [uncultured Clostridium sp.]|uniref:hypothetical protein n=1 Tax=uncultured Clostridium sp. TaxID=59620 RepID=UPI003217A6BD